MSTRVFSVLLLLLCLMGIYYGLGITTEFSYEPVGPKPFPVGTLVFIAGLCVLLFFFGDRIEISWGSKIFYQKMLIFIGAFLMFAYGFEYFGFILMATFLAFFTACAFGAKYIHALIFAPLLSVSLYLMFDLMLEVNLPIGLIFD